MTSFNVENHQEFARNISLATAHDRDSVEMKEQYLYGLGSHQGIKVSSILIGEIVTHTFFPDPGDSGTINGMVAYQSGFYNLRTQTGGVGNTIGGDTVLHYQMRTVNDLPSDIISVNYQGKRYNSLNSFQKESMKGRYDEVLYPEEKTEMEDYLVSTAQTQPAQSEYSHAPHASSKLVIPGLGPFGGLYALEPPFSLIPIANQLMEQSEAGPSS